MKRAIQKTAEATCDIIGNKNADKIRNISKSLKEFDPKEFHSQNVSEELHSKKLHSKTWEWDIDAKRKIHISRKSPTNYWWIKVNKSVYMA